MLDFPAQEDETLGDRIRNLRIIHGMSQDDLAKAVGVSNRTVSTWERDARMPRMGPIEKMVKLFNVSKPYLMLGQKDEKSPTAVTSEASEEFIKLAKKIQSLPSDKQAIILQLIDTLIRQIKSNDLRQFAIYRGRSA